MQFLRKNVNYKPIVSLDNDDGQQGYDAYTSAFFNL